MRDSLSLFDQAIAHAAGPVRADAVRQMLGLADRTRVIDLFDSLARGDIASAFKEFREQYDTGADPIVVLSDLAEFVNFVTRVKIVPATADNVAFGETERVRAREFAVEAFDARAVADVADAAQGHHRGAGRDTAGGGRRNGAGAHRLCRRHADAGRSDPDARAERRRLAGGSGECGAARRRRPRPCPRCQSAPASCVVRAASRCRGVRAPADGCAPRRRRSRRRRLRITSFPQLVALAGEKRDLLIKAALEADMRLVRIEDGRLEIALEPHARARPWSTISRASWNNGPGGAGPWSCPTRPASRRCVRRTHAEKNQRERAAEADPRVQEVLARFPGAKVVEVRRLAAEPPESDATVKTRPRIPTDDD